ncbi:putative transcriptional regulator [Filimonas zeae]|nr:putative transcriptional regulator [Filimonas zeae]
MPAKFVVDKNGNIRFKNTGFVAEDEISTMVELAGILYK